MKDVYITDHVRKNERFITHSDAEDEQFYNYRRSLEEYKPVYASKRGSNYERYEKGSLAQIIFDPLGGASKDSNGTLNYVLQDKELSIHLKPENLRTSYERYKSRDACEDDEAEEARLSLFQEMTDMNIPVEQWEKYIQEELSVFKEGEKYDFVKDMQNAFERGLSTPLADKILETIPEYVFWDIKRPINKEEEVMMNRYNPGRRVHVGNFFDARSWEEYKKEKNECRKIAPTVSNYKNYWWDAHIS